MPLGEERRGAVCGRTACTVRCRRREETRPVGKPARPRRLPPTLPRALVKRVLHCARTDTDSRSAISAASASLRQRALSQREFARVHPVAYAPDATRPGGVALLLVVHTERLAVGGETLAIDREATMMSLPRHRRDRCGFSSARGWRRSSVSAAAAGVLVSATSGEPTCRGLPMRQGSRAGCGYVRRLTAIASARS
jgi:hypothetical protein